MGLGMVGVIIVRPIRVGIRMEGIIPQMGLGIIREEKKFRGQIQIIGQIGKTQ